MQQLETEQSQAQDDDEVDDVAVGQWAAMQALDGAQHPIGEKYSAIPTRVKSSICMDASSEFDISDDAVDTLAHWRQPGQG